MRSGHILILSALLLMLPGVSLLLFPIPTLTAVGASATHSMWPQLFGLALIVLGLINWKFSREPEYRQKPIIILNFVLYLAGFLLLLETAWQDPGNMLILFNVALFLLMALAFVYAYLSVEVWQYFISKLP